MMIKRLLSLTAAALLMTGCTALRHHDRNANPYEKRLFVEKYLDPTHNPLDAQIQRTIVALRAQPHSAALHNQLGQLLVQKGFPKDAELEFERALNEDHRLSAAWYNLGLLRMARGNWVGAHVAFLATVRYKPGHAVALFQLGLMEEQRGHQDAAVEYYAKAFGINRALLDVRVNPRILDTKLVDLALLRLYPKDHARGSMQFQPTPANYVQRNLEAASAQPEAQQIVTPVPPVTDPSRQTPPPTPGQPVLPPPAPATPPPT